MTDMRDKQPNERTLDFTRDTFGNRKYRARLHVWPYSGLKSEGVYSRTVLVIFWAENMRAAFGFCESIAATIKAAHDVWETGVDAIEVAQ